MQAQQYQLKTYKPLSGHPLRAWTIISMHVLNLGIISLSVHGNLAQSRFWVCVISIFAAKNLDFSRSLPIAPKEDL